MKKIYVSGCSHVYGHGFPDSRRGDKPSKYAWPQLLKKEGFEIVNHSIPGNSAARVAYNFINYNEKQSLDGIAVIFPDMHRFLIKDQYGNDDNYYPEIFPKPNKYFKYYLKNIRNDKAEIAEFVSYVSLFYFFAAELDIPIYTMVSISPDRFVEQLLSKEIPSWNEFCYNYPRLPDGHYGHEAHEKLAKKVKDFFDDF